MGKEIKSEDISVVVQGKIEEKTLECLKSIRKHLTNSEIILSTWEGSDVSGLDYDVLVLSVDPGARIHFYYENIPNNVNRQLISTKNGLQKAQRKYCLKIRSDLILQNNNFLEYWDKFQIVNNEFKIFEHRMLVSTIFSRENSDQTGVPIPFHPSDWWFFGLTSDMKKYFLSTIPLDDKEFDYYNFKYPHKLPYTFIFLKYAPEQYYCFSCVKQFFSDTQFDDWTDWNEKNVKLSLNILYNNFIFLGLNESGIYSEKHRNAMRNENNIFGLITFNKFQARYKEYCDSNYIFQESNNSNSKDKIDKHLAKLRENAKKQTAIFSEIFAVLYYLIKVLFEFIYKKL